VTKAKTGELPGRIAILLVVLVLLVLGFLTIRVLLVPLVAASFVAYLFEPGVAALQRRGLKRGTAFILLFSVGIISIAVMLRLLPSWLRIDSINASSSGFADRLERQLDSIEASVSERFPAFQSVQLASHVNRSASDFAARLFDELPGLLESFTLNLLLVPFIAYFMVRDGRNLRRRIVSLVPNRYFEMTLIMLHRVDQQIGGYLRGRLIECTLVGITQMITMGMTALFVPQPQILLISAVCGATNLIPYLGPLMGAGFGILLYLGAYGLPLPAVYGLLAATLAAHLIDNVAIAPVVLSYNVDLHPLTVTLVLVIGGKLLGVLGLLIAIPVAASLKVIAQEVYGNYQLQSRLAG